ncbi:hypothetical protein VIGAN_09021600 [Vigna angularis var. angularis]|uniref:Uncharacterized protein n=1 Tax=Vigna angularis var. angularis TaxID=157739 RepID=A0A0S3SVX2_PHAAN|nr:hypothetical protein VIGAN_09021600 [Vigna angularis var. angularis]
MSPHQSRLLPAQEMTHIRRQPHLPPQPRPPPSFAVTVADDSAGHHRSLRRRHHFSSSFFACAWVSFPSSSTFARHRA